MNFLAHLHLASLAESSLLGNLMADFVRGDPYIQFPALIADGIMLHRRVDVMTDQLPLVQDAKRLFSAKTRRVAPITLDVVWDHFLSKEWHSYHFVASLPNFVSDAKNDITAQLQLPAIPESFHLLNRYLWQENWLEAYADFDFIREVLKRMSRQRPKLAMLADSFEDVKNHYEELRGFFHQFYPALMDEFRAPDKQITL